MTNQCQVSHRDIPDQSTIWTQLLNGYARKPKVYCQNTTNFIMKRGKNVMTNIQRARFYKINIYEMDRIALTFKFHCRRPKKN